MERAVDTLSRHAGCAIIHSTFFPNLAWKVPMTSSTSSLPPRLLIVDDDEQLAEALAHRFQRTGYQATLASTGEQGLELAGQRPFDIVLLDLHLPGVDGL